MIGLAQIEWERILDRFGWPTLILIVVAIIARTFIYPLIKQKLEAGDRAQARVTELLENQVLKADQRIERADRIQEGLLVEFKDAVEQVGRDARRQTEVLEELLRRTPRQ